MKRVLTIATVALLSLAGTAGAQVGYRPGSAPQIVDTWYRHYLGRVADQAGFDYWVPRLASQDPQQTLSELLASDEYYNRNGGTPDGLVLGLYRDVLGRTPAQLRPQDVDYWVNKMAQYGSRGAMIGEFLHDANTDIFNPPGAPAPVYSAPPPPPAPVSVTPAPTVRPWRWYEPHRHYNWDWDRRPPRDRDRR
jgi:hypothetical protein